MRRRREIGSYALNFQVRYCLRFCSLRHVLKVSTYCTSEGPTLRLIVLKWQQTEDVKVALALWERVSKYLEGFRRFNKGQEGSIKLCKLSG